MIRTLALAVTTNPSRDYVTLGGQILIAMIGAFALIVVAWFQFVYRPGRKSQDGVLETIRHQVENSHETNMRDDIDGLAHKVDELATVIDAVAITSRSLVESITVVHGEITTVRDDTSGLHRAVAGLRQEVTQLRNP